MLKTFASHIYTADEDEMRIVYAWAQFVTFSPHIIYAQYA